MTMLESVRAEIAEVLQEEVDPKIVESTSLEDLVDSLEFLQLIQGVESTFGIEIPSEEAMKIETVSDLCKAAEKYAHLSN